MEMQSSSGGTSGIGTPRRGSPCARVAVVACTVSAGPSASVSVTCAWASVRPAGPGTTVSAAGPAPGARR